MKHEARIFSISWIPSESVSGPMKAGMSVGLGHYDSPPPGQVDDLEPMRANDEFRFGNELTAWVEFDALGRPVEWGQGGGVVMGATTVKLGLGSITLAAVKLPDLRPEPVVRHDSVTFVQTCGGRTAFPLPRAITGPPYFRMQSPWVWSTLRLTIRSTGDVTYSLDGASPFPRHWVYDTNGALALKAGVAEWEKWLGQPSWEETPWGAGDSPVVVAQAETALERELSTLVMHGAHKPAIAKVDEGEDLVKQGDPGGSIHLLLDGVLDVPVDGESVGVVGPGAILGERAILEDRRRTATLRALTPAKVATVPPEAVDVAALRELSLGHHREDQRTP